MRLIHWMEPLSLIDDLSLYMCFCAANGIEDP